MRGIIFLPAIVCGKSGLINNVGSLQQATYLHPTVLLHPKGSHNRNFRHASHLIQERVAAVERAESPCGRFDLRNAGNKKESRK